MITLRNSLLLAVILLPAGAYGQAQCAIELGKPGQVKEANSALAKAALFLENPAQLSAALKEAVAKIQKDDAKLRGQNPVGRAMTLGTIYSQYTRLPDHLVPVSRGSLGFTENPGQMVDLVAATDSMFDIVEASSPACATETEGQRRVIYALLVNQAVNAYNAHEADSALAVVARALSVYDGMPLAHFAYSIRANSLQLKSGSDEANKDKLLDEAEVAYKQGLDLKKADSTAVDERKDETMKLANLMLGRAEGFEGAQKSAQIAKTLRLLSEYSKEFPEDVRSDIPMLRATVIQGDSSAIRAAFARVIGRSSAYDEGQLGEAAVLAAQADRTKEAVDLLDLSLKRNPFSRDALFNSAVTLQRLDRLADADAMLRRVVAVDPENREVYQLFTLNFRAMVDKIKATASKKPADSPEGREYKTLNDSLFKYFNRFNDAPANVTFKLWSHDGSKHTLAGDVENRTDAEKSYAIKLEFLNSTGAVVATKELAVGGVASKKSKEFKAEVEGAGIVAFRYAPFPQ